MPAKTHTIIKGNTRMPIGGHLLRPDNSPVDLTDLTVTFTMIEKDGTPVVDGATALVVDAEAGKVSYTFKDADVDTAGVFYAYFIAESGGRKEHFPVESRTMAVWINNM